MRRVYKHPSIDTHTYRCILVVYIYVLTCMQSVIVRYMCAYHNVAIQAQVGFAASTCLLSSQLCPRETPWPRSPSLTPLTWLTLVTPCPPMVTTKLLALVPPRPVPPSPWPLSPHQLSPKSSALMEMDSQWCQGMGDSQPSGEHQKLISG